MAYAGSVEWALHCGRSNWARSFDPKVVVTGTKSFPAWRFKAIDRFMFDVIVRSIVVTSPPVGEANRKGAAEDALMMVAPKSILGRRSGISGKRVDQHFEKVSAAALVKTLMAGTHSYRPSRWETEELLRGLCGGDSRGAEFYKAVGEYAFTISTPRGVGLGGSTGFGIAAYNAKGELSLAWVTATVQL